jgi:hypothetical protein
MPPGPGGRRGNPGLGWPPGRDFRRGGSHRYLGILRRGEASSAMTSDTMLTQT